MVCPKCGLEAYPNDRFCAGCGTYLGKDARVGVKAKPVPAGHGAAATGPGAPPPGHSLYEPAAAAAAIKTGPEGVKGWLLLLVLGMTILGPLVAVVQLHLAFTEMEKLNPAILSFGKYNTFKSSVWAVQIIFLVILVYGGIGLNSGRDRSVVKRAMAILWLSGPLANVLAGLLIPAMIFGSENVTLSKELTVEILRSFLTALIWTQYLNKSKRVRNTYGDA